MAVKQRAIILIVMVTVLAYVFTVKLFGVPGVNVWTQNAEVQLQLVEEYIRQRNHLSRMLNSNQQIVGQIECEVLFYHMSRNTTNYIV